MTKLKISKKIFNLSIIFAFLCSVFLSFANFNAACEELRQNVLRLHIVANSNSKFDQALKLKIRDAILEESSGVFENVRDLDGAVAAAQNDIERFCNIANRVIKENNAGYLATAYIGDSYFETRVYDDFTLPAGVYKSLIVSLGKAKGKNWWCVIFPEVCIPTAMGDLEQTVSSESSQIAKQPQGYVMRFKIVEIYEKIKKLIK